MTDGNNILNIAAGQMRESDPRELEVTRFFNQNKIAIELTPELEETYLILEKSKFHENNSEPLDDIVFFQCQYGSLSMSNPYPIINTLTRIEFSIDDKSGGEDGLDTQCMFLPKAMTELFGGIQPYRTHPKSLQSALYGVALKVESSDLLLQTEIRAEYKFWENLIQDIDVNFLSQSNLQSLNDRVSTVTVPVSVGKTKIHSQYLDHLEIGDVLLLDSCYLDSDGQGTIDIDNVRLNYRITMNSNSIGITITGNE